MRAKRFQKGLSGEGGNGVKGNVDHCPEMIGKWSRHPKNKFGQGSPEFWEAEYKLYGVSKEEYHRRWNEQAPKCPVCGTPAGSSPGTGNCGCELS